MSHNLLKQLTDEQINQYNKLFRKPYTSVNIAPVKQSQTRKLKFHLVELYQNNLTGEQIDVLINTSKTKQLMCNKLSNGCSLYYIEPCKPLFIDLFGITIIPTLYTLYQLHDILPPIYTYNGVSKYVLRGSDCMLAGVVHDKNANEIFHKKWEIGQCRALYTQGNILHAYAVVILLVDTDYIVKNGWSGKCCVTIHCVNDMLYQSSDININNPGFLSDQIISIDNTATLDDNKIVDNCEQFVSAGKDENAESSTTVESKPNITSNNTSTDTDTDDMNELSIDNTVQIDHDNSNRSVHTISRHDMDNAIKQALYCAILTRIQSNDLPITASKFMCDYLEMCHTSTLYKLDLKHSTYKQLSQFLKQMQSDNLLTYKSKQNDILITTVNTHHSALNHIIIDKTYTDAIKMKHKYIAREQRRKLGRNAVRPHQSPTITILHKYRIPSTIHNNLPNVISLNKSSLYTMQQAKQLLFDYIGTCEVERSGSAIKLTDELYRSLWSNNENKPLICSKAELAKRYEKLLLSHQYYYIYVQHADTSDSDTDTNISDTQYHKGTAPCIDVVVESRSGNKSVTKITNFTQFHISPDTLCHDAQHKFASSATVSPITNNKTNKTIYEILIQGNITEQISDWLHTQYGVPTQFVSITVPAKLP